MENYQLFFPCSSSSTTLSLYDHGSPNLRSSDDGFHCESSNDSFLGMKTISQFLDIPRGEPKNMFQSGRNDIKFGRKKRDKNIRTPKFSFLTRSPVDILDDGYRWRKYGQKAVKNNRFPRSYYRCTHKGCKVKKQVQRVTGDEGLVVTTYESIHTHPLGKPTDNFEHILNQMQIYPPLFT